MTRGQKALPQLLQIGMYRAFCGPGQQLVQLLFGGQHRHIPQQHSFPGHGGGQRSALPHPELLALQPLLLIQRIGRPPQPLGQQLSRGMKAF